MRIAYSVGTTSFGSFPGVSLKLNGFSTAAFKDLTGNKTGNSRNRTRMASSKLSLFSPIEYRGGRRVVRSARPAVAPYLLHN